MHKKKAFIRARDFSLLQNFQKGSGAQPAFCTISIAVLAQGKGGWGLISSSHLYLVLRLRLSRAIHLLPYIPSWSDRDNLPHILIPHTIWK
jgi:hypothetical protein